MAISHYYWHLVVKNGNFTLLLTSSGEKWQLADVPEGLPVDLHPKCIMGYILWDVFGSHFGFFKKRWKFPLYFWIIRVVNSHFAWYSYVRCNPLNTPNTPKHPHMTITNFNYENSYVPDVICNVVKADLGRSPGRCTPHPQMHHGMYMMGCIWQPFWILQEKVGISCYFWIIRVVNSHLAL